MPRPVPAMSDPEMIALVGRALFGSYWRERLADVLQISERSVRRYADGVCEIPNNVRKQLLILLERYIQELTNEAYRLRYSILPS